MDCSVNCIKFVDKEEQLISVGIDDGNIMIACLTNLYNNDNCILLTIKGHIQSVNAIVTFPNIILRKKREDNFSEPIILE